MARYNRRRHRRIIIRIAVSLIIILITALGAFLGKDHIASLFGGGETTKVVDGQADFHFIDVGQGDAAMICLPEGNILIDAGTNASEDELQAYLDKQGIKTIEYAVFTHPHEDHIGGADMIMKNYDVRHVVLPNIESTTATYTKMISAIEASGATLIKAEPGKTFSVGDMDFVMLAPLSEEYKDLNNYSVVIKATFGGTSVLFTGDAENVSEEEMLSEYGLSNKLDCDVLKVGHHGSDSSSTETFLRAVSPTHAIISCGEDNEYGHPHAEIMSRLETLNIPILCTKDEGSIIMTSDGKGWTVKS